MTYYFRPGAPWIDEKGPVFIRVICPVHVYGPDIQRGFVVDASFIYNPKYPSNSIRSAFDLAETIAEALTRAAADPKFDLRSLLAAVRENV